MLPTPQIGTEVTHLVNDDPSDDYLMAAFRLLSNVKGSDQVARQYVLVSCVSSFLSLEAAINRLYHDAFVREDGLRRSVKVSIPQPLIDFIRQSWARMSVKDKYLLLPPVLEPTDFSFCPSKPPFPLFEEFIRFRNRLVHPKVIEHSYKILVTEVSDSSESSASWGGTVLQKQSGAAQRKSVFPLTDFATSFDELSAVDAEKAFEIAVRMRLALSLGVHAAPPTLFYDADGKLSVQIGASIGAILKLQFGDLQDETPKNGVV